jgi:methylmalonyl-CoA mutase N-terminal domain/subunit
LRTQQIIAHESGVTNIADPLGGSYFVESLTLDLEREAYAYFETIDGMGGMVAAIERGYPQKEVAESAYRFQQAVEAGDKIIVGVNGHVTEGETPLTTLYIDEAAGDRQTAKLRRLKQDRSNESVTRALDALRRAGDRGLKEPSSVLPPAAHVDPNRSMPSNASPNSTLMPLLLDAVRVYATIGEMCDAFRDVWGEWNETPTI